MMRPTITDPHAQRRKWFINLVKKRIQPGTGSSITFLNQRRWTFSVSNLWAVEAIEHPILRQLEDSPSLKNHLKEKLQQCYQDGCKLASKHSQLSKNTFPSEPIAPLEEVLDENWLP